MQGWKKLCCTWKIFDRINREEMLLQAKGAGRPDGSSWSYRTSTQTCRTAKSADLWVAFFCVILIFTYMSVAVSSACLSVYHTYAWNLYRPEEDIKSSKSAYIWLWMWELNLGFLEEQPVLLIAEPSFQRWVSYFEKVIGFTNNLCIYSCRLWIALV